MSTEPVSPPPSDAPSAVSADDRTWGLIAHLSSLAMFLGFPVIGPLIVWLVKKGQSAYVADHAKEALNFQITMLLATAVVLVVGLLTCGIGLIVWPLVVVANVVFTIVAAIRANEGGLYRYPFCLRLVT